MGSLTNSGRSIAADAVLGISPAASRYVALYNGDPAGAGVELSGNGYARVAATFSQTNGSGSNSSGVTFPTASGNWSQATHMAVFTASSGGTMVASDDLTTSQTVTTGNYAFFNAGELTTVVT